MESVEEDFGIIDASEIDSKEFDLSIERFRITGYFCGPEELRNDILEQL